MHEHVGALGIALSYHLGHDEFAIRVDCRPSPGIARALEGSLGRFEEAAGLVTIDLMQKNGRIIGAELLSPQLLVRHTEVSSSQAAACLGSAEGDIRTDAHMPQVVSVGLPFLFVKLASREALRRTHPDRGAYDALFPLDGARAVYAYVHNTGDEGVKHGCDLHSRMLCGAEVSLHARHGEDMGRPSTLLTRSAAENGETRAHIGERCAAMFNGVFNLG